MLSNDSKNDAIFGGLLGLVLSFLAVENRILPLNQVWFIAMIFSFLLVALMRVFGILLEYDWLKNGSLTVFKYIVTPLSVGAFSGIIATQIFGLYSLGNFIPAVISFGIFQLLYFKKLMELLDIEIVIRHRKKK